MEAELKALDNAQRTTKQASSKMRANLVETERRATDARVRVRDRRSLIARLDALRGQYADDLRKLNFVVEAERLFDPLQVVVCPACLQELENPPHILDSHCSLCRAALPADANDGVGPSRGGDPVVSTGFWTQDGGSREVLEAEVRAVRSRLASLNEYVVRLNAHQELLIGESVRADEAAEDAAQAVDAITSSPAPWLAVRDALTKRISQARLDQQSAQAGASVWTRVTDAESRATDLEEQAREIGALRRRSSQRPDRDELVSALSARFGAILAARFGAILAEIGYPKLHDPYVANDLVPFVRGQAYTEASSGGLVFIALAWTLSLWELAHERNADAPGLLVIDSPQKNLGHQSKPGDNDFADVRLVENFYTHAKKWLAGDGVGAQLIVVDNSPPAIVEDDVVVRFTRSAEVSPYGLIPEASS